MNLPCSAVLILVDTSANAASLRSARLVCFHHEGRYRFQAPIFAPVEVRFDMDGRSAQVSVPGVLETHTQPIKNPVTGAPHRIQVVVPEGFEHIKAEIASSRIESRGGIPFSVPEGHSSLATVEQTPKGVAA
jgi:hypothetical protein